MRHLDDEICFKDLLHDVVDLNPMGASLSFNTGVSANQINFCFDSKEVGSQVRTQEISRSKKKTKRSAFEAHNKNFLEIVSKADGINEEVIDVINRKMEELRIEVF